MEKKIKISNLWGLRVLILVAITIVILNVFNAVSTVFSINFFGNLAGVQTSSGGSIDTSGWTADEKMNYEMHGIVPARVQQGQQQLPSGQMLPYGVTFDQAGYNKLVGYYNSITLDSLTPEQRQRFIRIGTGDRTGCGPCCGIQNGPALDANGNSRCGCEHIFALIGLMKHIVKDYGDKYTDDQVFSEIVKWKKLFFPGQVADDGSVIG